MGFERWYSEGYGFPLYKIHATKSSVEKLLELAPKYKSQLQKESFWESLEAAPENDEKVLAGILEELREKEDFRWSGLALVMSTVLNEMADSQFGKPPFGRLFIAEVNEFGNEYIILPRFYPHEEELVWFAGILGQHPNFKKDCDNLFITALAEMSSNAAIAYYDM